MLLSIYHGPDYKHRYLADSFEYTETEQIRNVQIGLPRALRSRVKQQVQYQLYLQPTSTSDGRKSQNLQNQRRSILLKQQ